MPAELIIDYNSQSHVTHEIHHYPAATVREWAKELAGGVEESQTTT